MSEHCMVVVNGSPRLAAAAPPLARWIIALAVSGVAAGGCLASADHTGWGGGGGPPAGGAGPPAGNTFTLPFAASNIPAGTTFTAPGDLIIASDHCGGTSVTIDTSKGTIDGCNDEPFVYQQITQADTSLGPLQAALFTTNRFVVATGMTVNVTGDLPLILVAAGDVNISGTLRASAVGSKAVAGGASGPGARGMGIGPGGGTSSASGGGGGGAFCGRGGDGGGAVGSGGHSYGNATLRPLLGGSSGGQAFADAGGGGGAIQLTSATSIQVTAFGLISAGGGGGAWSGSGAGSGGAILLEAPSVAIAGTVAANGGGGGGADTLGQSGQDANGSAVAAAGGSSQDGASNNGGAGSAGATVDGTSVATPATGGGGGGGAGRIRVNTRPGAAALSGTLSPAVDPCLTQGMLGG